MVEVNFLTKTIRAYDSLNNGDHRLFVDKILRYLNQEHQVKKKGVPLPDIETWKANCFRQTPTDTPQQSNGYDCGVFMLETGRCLAKNIPIPFDFCQGNMPDCRMRIAQALLRGSLE
jgi:Ulp1 family protease